MKTRTLFSFVALALACLIPGCVTVGAPERQLISNQASNARVFSEKLDTDMTVPGYVKTWVKGEADSWTNLEAWSQGKSATSGK